MTSFESIAGVSATLRNLLRDRMSNPVPITIAPPDVTVAGMSGQRANLYLYQVSENAYLKNQQIPGEGHPASFGRPPLSLDLAYLVTAYGTSPDGADADLQAQQVLGDVMQAFHDYPIISDTLHQNDDANNPLIMDPSLLGAFERLKVSLQPSSLDDITKIWGALPEAAFRRSVTYHVAVIQIDTRRPRQQAVPVRQRVVRAFPFKSPFIERVFPAAEPSVRARTPGFEAGETLVIVGQQLGAAGTRVRIGGVVVEPTGIDERRLELIVPASLSAGSHVLRCVQPAVSGEGFVAPAGAEFESNSVAILVLPRIQSILPSTGSAGDSISIGVSPSVSAGQSRALFLNELELRGEQPAPGAPAASTLAFRLPTGPRALAAGSYLVRLRVDGVESRLTLDSASQAYDGPRFTVNA